jgi:hypothetical protein
MKLLITRSLRDAHKIKAYKAVRWMNFYEIWYGHYATGGHSNIIILISYNILQSAGARLCEVRAALASLNDTTMVIFIRLSEKLVMIKRWTYTNEPDGGWCCSSEFWRRVYSSVGLKMEIENFSETLASTDESTRRQTPEDHHHHPHHREYRQFDTAMLALLRDGKSTSYSLLSCHFYFWNGTISEKITGKLSKSAV